MMKETVLEIIENNQGITKKQLGVLVNNQYNITHDVLENVIKNLSDDKKIRIIKIEGKECLYLMGQSKGNQAFYKNHVPSTNINIKHLVLLLLVVFCIAAFFASPMLRYFGVILLIIYCIFTWVFRP